MFYIEKSTNMPKQKYILEKKKQKKDLFQETKTIQMIIIEESDKTHNYQKHCELIHMHYLKDSRNISRNKLLNKNSN